MKLRSRHVYIKKTSKLSHRRPGEQSLASLRSSSRPARSHAGRLPAVFMTVVQALPAFGTSSGLLKV